MRKLEKSLESHRCLHNRVLEQRPEGTYHLSYPPEPEGEPWTTMNENTGGPVIHEFD